MRGALEDPPSHSPGSVAEHLIGLTVGLTNEKAPGIVCDSRGLSVRGGGLEPYRPRGSAGFAGVREKDPRSTRGNEADRFDSVKHSKCWSSSGVAADGAGGGLRQQRPTEVRL